MQFYLINTLLLAAGFLLGINGASNVTGTDHVIDRTEISRMRIVFSARIVNTHFDFYVKEYEGSRQVDSSYCRMTLDGSFNYNGEVMVSKYLAQF